MRFKAIILTSIFQWVVITALVGIFAAAQTAAPGSLSHLYRVQLSTGQTVSGKVVRTVASGAFVRLGEVDAALVNLPGVSGGAAAVINS